MSDLKENADPKISVIVPIYNVEKFLNQCVDSILNQTYRNLEIILVDDGSPDNCPKICDEYAKKDNRIIVIHKKNGGLSDARNVGLDIATGKYVSFVDSDDYIFPEMIQTLWEMCMENSSDLSVCAFTNCSEQGEIIGEICKEKNVKLHVDNRMKDYLVGRDIGVSACGKLYRMSLFDEIRFPYGKYHEDSFTTYKLVHAAKCITSTKATGYIYRKNSNSIMHEVFNPKRLHMVEASLEMTEFLREKYPQLVRLGRVSIISMCNVCVMEMGETGYSDNQTDLMIKDLYRKYWRDFLKSHASLKAKAFVVATRVNYKFTKWISKYVCENKWK